MDEQPLEYGFVSSPVKVGDTVRRQTGPWTPTIHALLDYLNAHDFGYTQKPLGIDEQHREILEFLPGQAATRPWPSALLTDDGIAQAATMLASYHQIVKDFQPPEDAQWRIGSKPLEPGQIIRHGDLGPWNTLWQDDSLTGLIDWDFAEPGEAITDLAQMAYYFIPLRGEHGWQEAGFDERPDLWHRLEVLCESYGRFTPTEVLAEVQKWLVEERRRTVEWGGEGREPWVRFLERGDDAEITHDLQWLESITEDTSSDSSVEEILSRTVPTPRFIAKSTLFGGRLDRTGYWLGVLYQGALLLPTVGLLIYARVQPDQWLGFLSESWRSVLFVIVLLATTILIGVMNISLTIRRQHDIEAINPKNPELYYTASYYLVPFAKGDPHDNAYGPPVRTRNPLVILGLKHPTS